MDGSSPVTASSRRSKLFSHLQTRYLRRSARNPWVIKNHPSFFLIPPIDGENMEQLCLLFALMNMALSGNGLVYSIYIYSIYIYPPNGCLIGYSEGRPCSDKRLWKSMGAPARGKGLITLLVLGGLQLGHIGPSSSMMFITKKIEKQIQTV